MNIPIVPHEQLKLTALDDVELIKKASEIREFIFLLEAGEGHGAFSREDVAELVLDYARGNPKIRPMVMMAGAAILHEAQARNYSVRRAVEAVFTADIAKYLEDWHAVRRIKKPERGAVFTIVKAPTGKPEP